MAPPPLPPAIQTTILSHLLPPNIPLPQQLLSKSLLQRHLYLPPSPDDVDAWLNPAPTPGIAELLERLTGTGWRVSGVDYAFDGEHYLARVKVVEDGRGEGEGEEVDVVFEFESGSVGGGEQADDGQEQDPGQGQEGRGWTYHSVHNGRSGNPISNLSWTTDIHNITTIEEHTGDSAEIHELDSDATDSAPAGYWAGFSPPASPRMNADSDGQQGEGEDDYWASYGKSFTPGGVTPAVQHSPAISRSQTRDQHPSPMTSTTNNDTHTNNEMNQDRPHVGEADGLLRSRIEMKIASLLRKIWISYLPTFDPELRALTFLSLARAVQQPSDITRTPTSGAEGDPEGTKGKMEVLYEVYGVIDDGDKEGFMRLVEKSLTANGSMDGFGVASRQDSSAQLNYWE